MGDSKANRATGGDSVSALATEKGIVRHDESFAVFDMSTAVFDMSTEKNSFSSVMCFVCFDDIGGVRGHSGYILWVPWTRVRVQWSVLAYWYIQYPFTPTISVYTVHFGIHHTRLSHLLLTKAYYSLTC